MKTITVYVASYDWTDSNLKAVEFIKEWQDNLNLVPEEFRENATIKVEVSEEYGYGYAEFELVYERPETEVELKQKQDEKEYTKAKKLAEYNKLKQELGL